jgi:hypothetical protein
MQFRKRTLEHDLRDLAPAPDDRFVAAQIARIGQPRRPSIGRPGFRLLVTAALVAGAVVMAVAFGGAATRSEGPAGLSGIFAADATETSPPVVTSCSEPGVSGNYTVTGTYPDTVQQVTVELLNSSNQVIASTTFAPSGGTFTFTTNTTTTSGVHAKVIQGQIVSADVACTKK